MHGFHHDMDIKRSWIGRVVLTALLTGAFLGLHVAAVDLERKLAGHHFR